MNTSIPMKNNDEISLSEVLLSIKDWFLFILSKWHIILFFSFIGLVVGWLYVRSQKPIYTANCTFVLENGSSGSLGSQMSGIGPLLGVGGTGSIGQSGNSGVLSLFQSTNYAALYKSRRIIEQTLLSEYEVDGKNSQVIEGYIRIKKYREEESTKKNFENIYFNIKRELYTQKHFEILNRIIDEVKSIYSIQNSEVGPPVLSIRVKLEDPLFPKIFGEKILESVNQFYLETKSYKARENIRLLERRTDSLRSCLYNAMIGVATAQQDIPNANTALQVIKVNPQRKQIEVGFLQNLYTSASNELEYARNEVRKILPFIIVLDKSTLPLTISEITFLYGISVSLVLSFILSVLILTLIRVIKSYL